MSLEEFDLRSLIVIMIVHYPSSLLPPCFWRLSCSVPLLCRTNHPVLFLILLVISHLHCPPTVLLLSSSLFFLSWQRRGHFLAASRNIKFCVLRREPWKCLPGDPIEQAHIFLPSVTERVPLQRFNQDFMTGH